MLFTCGDKYEGYFIDDQFEGIGMYTYANGDTKRGIWVKGELVENQK
jgi:hypothetical protein